MKISQATHPKTLPPINSQARCAREAFAGAGAGFTLGLKRGARPGGAPAFAGWRGAAGAVADVDLFARVPLHWRRLFHRRYNQAALLALALGRLVARPVVADLLVRRRPTPTQGRLGPPAPRRNGAGAFTVPPRRPAGLAGRRGVLGDDGMTR